MGIVSEYRIEKQFKHNILSVIFDSDSFFYSISDVSNRLKLAVKYELEENPLVEIPKIIKEETLDQHYYSAVNIFSKSDKFTFVPSEEYNYGVESAFVRNSFDLLDEEVAADLSPKGQLRIIHSHRRVFQNALSGISNELNFRHISLAYIEGVKNFGLHVHLYKESMAILVRNEEGFKFYNQFKASSDEERLYFIMLTFDQLALDPATTPVYISASNERIKEIHQTLDPYVGNIKEEIPTFLNLENTSDLRDLYLASICE